MWLAPSAFVRIGKQPISYLPGVSLISPAATANFMDSCLVFYFLFIVEACGHNKVGISIMDVQCWVDGRPRDHIMDWLLTVDDTDVGNRRGSTRELDSPLKPTGRCGFTSSAPITSDTPGKRLYQHHRRRPGKNDIQSQTT